MGKFSGQKAIAATVRFIPASEWGESPLPCGEDGEMGTAITQHLDELDFLL